MKRAAVIAAMLAGCSGDESVFDRFTDALTFEVPYTSMAGPLPAADPSVTTQITQNALSLLVLAPGDTTALPIAWTGGSIAAVDWSFGGSRYLDVPLPNGNNASSGSIALPADLASDVCDHLDKQCYDIPGLEIARSLQGGATGSASLAIKLDCSGTHACGGGSGNDLSMSMTVDFGPRDMAVPRDLAKPSRDLAVVLPDLGPDLSIPGDGSTPPDLVTSD